MFRATPRRLLWAPLAASAALLAMVTAGAQQVFAKELVVSAAMSLKGPLTKIAEDFKRTHQGDTVSFNFGASGQLARQIERGADSDVFVSASPDQITYLEKRRLIAPAAKTVLAYNRLVLIAPSGRKVISKLSDLVKCSKIAVGDPSIVPAGTYAQQSLEKAGIFTELQRAHKLVFAESARQILTYVEGGNVDAGIVYATDVALGHNVQTCFQIDPTSTLPIMYVAAVTKETKSKQLAEDYVNLLVAPSSQKIFRSMGFRTTQ